MKKVFTLILLSMIAFNAIHAEITWTLSDSGTTLTISGTNMPDYELSASSGNRAPWYSERGQIYKVIIKNGVTNIGSYAFNDCRDLTSITIPNSVTSIGRHAFRSCYNLTFVTIPNSVTSVGNSAFDETKWYNSQPDGLIYTGLALYKYKGTMPANTNIVVKEGTTCIGANAFSRCSGLTSITIPNSVTSIGDYAFYVCSGLTSITIPNSVTSIGNHAFSFCSGLTSIIVESGNKYYDSGNDCNAIIEKKSNTLISGCMNTIIPNYVTSIGDEAFSGCSGLTSITIPNSVTSIGQYAFSGCKGLISFTIPKSVTSIGNYAFSGCSGLTSITIPNSVTSIGNYAFSGCSGLTSITIPNSVTSIGEYAFQNCTSLSSFTIPNSVTSIENYAFYNCTSLASITIPNSVTSISNHPFKGCSNLTSIVIPESVTSIGGSAFSGCSGLTSVTIPNSVASIGGYAFYNCPRLTSITIPSSVTSIGSSAFSGCSGLASITCEASIPPNCQSDCFGGVYKFIPLYVPTNSIAQYNAAYGWNEFTNTQAIIEPESISFANANEKIIIGKTKTLTAIITPDNSINKTITWSSSNTTVAVISSDGVVTAKSLGTSTITATTYNGKTATCKITVEKPVTAIALSDVTTTLWVGDTKALTTTVTPTDASNTAVKWSSSNNSVATVSTQGVITAKGKGTCTITCTAADGYGKKATCSVTVNQQVTSITLSDVTTSLWVGETKTLIATITPTTVSNTAVNWASSDNNVATVSSKGVITAKGKGTCTIICTAADGYGTKSECSITVKQPVVSITLSSSSATLWVGDTKTLTAKTTPTTATNTAVNWSSSNSNVATVSSNGLITAKGKGNCTITCTAADGYGTKSTCKVTVKQQVTSIDLGNETLTMTCGSEKILTPTISPSNADIKKLAWISTDNNVADVTSEGVLTAVCPGTATITCTATDDFKESCSITVNVVPFDITDKNPTIEEGTYGEGGISYTRTLTENKYTTFCMPYDINLGEYTEYFSNVYVPTGMAFVKFGTTLMVMFKSVSLTETIRAGQPFIALASKTGTVAIKNGSKLTITSLGEPQPINLEVYNFGSNLIASNKDVDVKITGNYSIVTDLDDANNFTFSVNGQMVSTTTVPPYRFYITKNDEHSSAKITDIQLSFDGEEATAVEDIINEQKGDGKYYNLNGQRINKSNAQKGVYIINGKKVVVK